MGIRLSHIDLQVLPTRTRMPFRYGIAAMTALPHLFVRAQVEIDGERQAGIASDGLAPKWFTKDPTTRFTDDLVDLLRVVRAACDFAVEAGEAPSVFELWRQVYAAQEGWGRAEGLPPLLWSFGVSLIERAAIDAFCRARSLTFAEAVRGGGFGIEPGAIHRELAGTRPEEMLPRSPLRAVVARHTVGLGDPLTDAEIPDGERLNDGLPQSLEGAVRAHGLIHLKIKLCGDVEGDVARLTAIGRAMEGRDFRFSLDGNEQYRSVAPFREVWRRLSGSPAVAPLLERLLFVEQPFHREVALAPETCADLCAWPARPPMIIDESDGELSSARSALAAGYVGTSHKNCKGVFKGIANACLLERRRRLAPEQPCILSGEDLANIGPVALLQDLCLMASLGIRSVERNGHHYFRGLSMFPPDLQDAVVEAHPDLYRRHDQGFATLRITNGMLDLGTVVDAPFGVGVDLEPWEFTPLEESDPAELGDV
jgi:hypothetical protein